MSCKLYSNPVVALCNISANIQTNRYRKLQIHLVSFQMLLLFSAHISYGKGKYLNQTVFFTEFAKN